MTFDAVLEAGEILMNGIIAREGEHTVLAAFPREHGEQLRVTLSRFRGSDFLLINHWYQERGIFRPGLRGLALSSEEWVPTYSAIRTAVDQLRGAGDR